MSTLKTKSIGDRYSDVVDRLVLYTIRDYQKYISPRKGFCCAYKKLYDDDSCSEYFRQAINNYGFISAVPLFQQRLEDCKLANRKLKAEIEESSTNDRQKKSEKNKNNVQNDNCVDSSYCSGFDNCEFSDCDTNHNGYCDVGDVSSCQPNLDCGGCDCSF